MESGCAARAGPAASCRSIRGLARQRLTRMCASPHQRDMYLTRRLTGVPLVFNPLIACAAAGVTVACRLPLPARHESRIFSNFLARPRRRAGFRRRTSSPAAALNGPLSPPTVTRGHDPSSQVVGVLPTPPSLRMALASRHTFKLTRTSLESKCRSDPASLGMFAFQ